MYSQKKIVSLLEKVKALEESAINAERENKLILAGIHPANKASACNLLHYLAIRAQDIRTLQKDLSALAISSISHSESYSLSNLRKIKYLLQALAGNPPKNIVESSADYKESETLLNSNSEALLGKVSFHGQTKIMVTLPTEAADDFEMIKKLIKTGMQIARINTAHDNVDVWEKMINHTKKAAGETGKEVKIYMDLEGPKIRTGEIKLKKHSKNKSKPSSIHLFTGSTITLTKAGIKGHGDEHPEISLTSPEVFGHVKSGEKVWFDDGKLGGMVISADKENIIVEITQSPEAGFKLKAKKGVNFPDSNLDIPALTEDDLAHLKFIAKHADMVGYSFVQKPEDVHALQKHLKKLKREDMGVILKIETRMAFENFPALLFAVMQSRHCGVMIARGDLAVGIGYLRIAEVQEEILWLAEAGHMPVIWATQVLETQVKEGTATRAEISDVVKAVRAECVMLNKGPYVFDAIKTVIDIDKRMAAHEDKKRKILRSLHVAKAFLETHKGHPWQTFAD